MSNDIKDGGSTKRGGVEGGAGGVDPSSKAQVKVVLVAEVIRKYGMTAEELDKILKAANIEKLTYSQDGMEVDVIRFYDFEMVRRQLRSSVQGVVAGAPQTSLEPGQSDRLTVEKNSPVVGDGVRVDGAEAPKQPKLVTLEQARDLFDDQYLLSSDDDVVQDLQSRGVTISEESGVIYVDAVSLQIAVQNFNARLKGAVISGEGMQNEDGETAQGSSGPRVVPETADHRKFLPLEDAAQFLGISPQELTVLREDGAIRGFRDGNSWKFRPQDLSLAKEKLVSADLEDLGFRRNGVPDEDDILPKGSDVSDDEEPISLGGDSIDELKAPEDLSVIDKNVGDNEPIPAGACIAEGTTLDRFGHFPWKQGTVLEIQKRRYQPDNTIVEAGEAQASRMLVDLRKMQELAGGTTAQIVVDPKSLKIWTINPDRGTIQDCVREYEITKACGPLLHAVGSDTNESGPGPQLKAEDEFTLTPTRDDREDDGDEQTSSQEISLEDSDDDLGSKFEADDEFLLHPIAEGDGAASGTAPANTGTLQKLRGAVGTAFKWLANIRTKGAATPPLVPPPVPPSLATVAGGGLRRGWGCLKTTLITLLGLGTAGGGLGIEYYYRPIRDLMGYKAGPYGDSSLDDDSGSGRSSDPPGPRTPSVATSEVPPAETAPAAPLTPPVASPPLQPPPQSSPPAATTPASPASSVPVAPPPAATTVPPSAPTLDPLAADSEKARAVLEEMNLSEEDKKLLEEGLMSKHAENIIKIILQAMQDGKLSDDEKRALLIVEKILRQSQ